MAKATDKPDELSLADFFSANDARRDRWSQLAACADAYGGGRGSSDKLLAQIGALLDEMEPLEQYWAYPGAGHMRTLRSLYSGRDAQGLANAVDRIKTSIFSGSYRRDPNAWNIEEDAEESLAERLPPGIADAATKPYFELLTVTPESGRTNNPQRELHRLRRPEDPFTYEQVQTFSFEDAMVATIMNTNLQAVVIYDGFQFKSRHALPALSELL